MFYTIYKITDLHNGKIYIGKHQTKNLQDKYFGSGKILSESIKEYGIENFQKEILFVFETEAEMNAKEAELVTEEFCSKENTYNICIGGKGGWTYLNDKSKDHIERTKRAGINGNKRCKELRKGIYSDNFIRPLKIPEIQQLGNTKEARAKASKSLKLLFAGNGHQQKDKNSQFNTMWIYSLQEKVCKKINKTDPVPDGWQKGRKMKFD